MTPGHIACVSLLVELIAVSEATTGSPVCPDGVNGVIDYGNLTESGPGRVLEIRRDGFYVHGDKVFLSGVAIPWVVQGYDFGNNNYEKRKDTFECYLRKVREAGGNAVRTFVHTIPFNTPVFATTSYVTGLDHQGTLITDLRKYLRAAAHYNIVVFLTLWENAPHLGKLNGLMASYGALNSYVSKALIPLALALKDEPGLGGYEIIHNEEELLIRGLAHNDPCFDTRNIQHTINGQQKESYSMQSLLRFISRQADGIRRVDPTTPITAGSVNIMYNTDQYGYFNYHKDECLLKAGEGRPQGYLTFYMTGAASHQGGISDPYKRNASDFHLDKPLVISGMNQGGSMTSENTEWLYNHGYNGAWSWSVYQQNISTTLLTHSLGTEAIKSKNGSGGLVTFSLTKYEIKIHH